MVSGDGYGQSKVCSRLQAVPSVCNKVRTAVIYEEEQLRFLTFSLSIYTRTYLQ